MILFILFLIALQESAPRNRDLSVWPNTSSSANSDAWLIKNHDKIRKMEPRVLVLNFCNGFSSEQALEKVNALIAALAESSRYHGYEDPEAPVFLQYRLAKLIDLSDREPAPSTPDGNCTKYPRVSNWKEGINFLYKPLYGEEFAAYYGYKDSSGRFLRLDELVAKGMINELWFLGYHRQMGSPFESTELKPVYDEKFNRVGDEHRHSGNGGDPQEPWFGRSLRILFINAERGVGCAMESLGHSFEGTANSGVIPYFRKYFYEYADFEMDKKYKLPVNSLYAVDPQGKDKAEYPEPMIMLVNHGGHEYRLSPRIAAGGSVHFPPNARNDYDLSNNAPVMSSIEHWRRFDGKDKKDIPVEFTNQKFQRYNELAPDCMGPWLVYWRQNMPGYKNKSLDDERRVMKNWWVFLFY